MPTNDRERTRERMAELGRKSGEARRRRRSRGFLDVWKGRAHADPDELYDALKSSPAGAVVIARVLEKAGVLGPEELEDGTPPIVVESAFGRRGFHGLIAAMVESGQKVAMLGVELSDEQRELVRERAAMTDEERARWRSARRHEGVPPAGDSSYGESSRDP